MGFGDSISKKLYMRKHSIRILKWSPITSNGPQFNIEDPEVELQQGLARAIIVVLCRNKQRLVQQAWNYWVDNARIKHNYQADVRHILVHPLADTVLRSELEIEVMYKWVMQNYNSDSTGICSSLKTSNRRSAIIDVLQHMRIEFYQAGDCVIFQGHMPKEEDGQFTILSGECEVLQLKEGSVTLQRLAYAAKKKDWNKCATIVASGQILATIMEPSGFGELSTLTEAKRLASIRAKSPIVEILVIPKASLIACIESKRSSNDDEVDENEVGKAMDFLRSSGLANRISPADFTSVAMSMRKRVMSKGEILYMKDEPVTHIYLVASGDFLLDTSDSYSDGVYIPFLNTMYNMCFTLGYHSILGDEGLVGLDNTFESTAVTISEAAFVYEVFGFGKDYLASRLMAARYTALAYKDLPKLTSSLELAEQINVYAHLNSLRKAIAHSYPTRGYQEQVQKPNQHTGSMKKIRDAAVECSSVYREVVDVATGTVTRLLTPASFHIIKALWKRVKAREVRSVKQGAQENILAHYIQDEEENGTSTTAYQSMLLKASEKKLNSTILEFQERMSKELELIKASTFVEKDVDTVKGSEARSILSAMASAGVGSSIDDDGTSDEQTNEQQGDNGAVFELTSDDYEVLALPRIEQYYYYIDMYTQVLHESSDTNCHNVPNKKTSRKTKSKKPMVYNASSAKLLLEPMYEDTPSRLGIPWRPPSPPVNRTGNTLTAVVHSKVVSRPNGMHLHLDHATLKKHQQKLEAMKRFDVRATFATNVMDDADDFNQKLNSMNDATHDSHNRRHTHRQNGISRDEESVKRFQRPDMPRTRRVVTSVHALTILQAAAAALVISDGTISNDAVVARKVYPEYEDPHEFYRYLAATEFNQRKPREQHLWKTRFMKMGDKAVDNASLDGCSKWLTQRLSLSTHAAAVGTDTVRHCDVTNAVEAVATIHEAPTTNNVDGSGSGDDDDSGIDRACSDVDGVVSDGASNSDGDGASNTDGDDIGDTITSEDASNSQTAAAASEFIDIIGTPVSAQQQPEQPEQRVPFKISRLQSIQHIGPDIVPGSLKELNQPSGALNAYEDLINSTKTSRQYLNGKLHCTSTSRFKLVKDIAKELEDTTTDAAVDDLSSSITALMNCLQPPTLLHDSTSMSIASSVTIKTTASKQSLHKYLTDVRKEQTDMKAKINRAVLESRLVTERNEVMSCGDHDLLQWQSYSVAETVKRNVGEKWTLPILASSSSSGTTGKKVSNSAANKWGSNLVRIAPVSEYETIKPPTYLDVYKKYNKSV